MTPERTPFGCPFRRSAHPAVAHHARIQHSTRGEADKVVVGCAGYYALRIVFDQGAETEEFSAIAAVPPLISERERRLDR